ncbi:threonine/serine exporter family protein, partial [bacterium]|nr:threonine/serine exporter family protein [bacterium]
SFLLVENGMLSLGFLAQDLSKVTAVNAFSQLWWFQALCHLVMTVSFCIFFHLPKRAFVGAVICGFLSVYVLEQFENPELFVLASFTASLTVGLLSLFLARIYNWPSQVFSTMGVLSLVPGLLALSSFYSATGSPAQGVIAYRVALTAGAITFGLFSARMPFRFYNSLYNLPVTK